MNSLRTLLFAGLVTSSWFFGPAGVAARAFTPREGDDPADHLPPHIFQLTAFGERADRSHDGKKVLFLTKTYGDALEIDVATRTIPDGKFTLVECDRQNRQGSGHVDLWKLKLDGSSDYQRLTYFSDYPGFKASNPVVSDDGKFISFQAAKASEAAGVGHGIFIYDIEKAKKAQP